MNDLYPEFVESFCEEATDLLEQWETLCMSMASECTKDNWDALFRMAHNLKGTSKAVGLEDFGNAVHKIEDIITIAKNGMIPVGDDLINWFLQGQTLLSKWVHQLKNKDYSSLDMQSYLDKGELLKTSTMHETSESGPEESLAIDEDILKQFELQENTVVSDVDSQEKRQEEKQEEIKEEKIEKSRQPVQAQKSNETVRVAASKLDEALEIVGELSIHQTILWHARAEIAKHNPFIMNSIYLSKKLIRDLHEKTLSLRMQPLQSVFQRLERTIRDISQTLKKDVQVKIYGSDVELDKLVCEKIIDPLTHMVRNAVDHGLEYSDDRIKSGKTATGTVVIEATQETSSVTISIRDDGKGLDPDKILKKAVEKGLVKSSEKFTANEILSLIFLPGFSTAEKLTDVSGRGVGMDVVMKSVEGLGGEVKIGSQVGKGTSFLISLPTSLSIVDALIFKLKGVRFAVPMNAIDEVLDLAQLSIKPGEKMLKYQDHVIPIVSMGQYLHINHPLNKEEVETGVFIVRSEKKFIALRFGDLVGEQQIVVRQLPPSLDTTFGFSGATILGDGDPGLIVDMNAIVDKFFKQFNHKESA